MELLALQTTSVSENEHLDYIGPVFKFFGQDGFIPFTLLQRKLLTSYPLKID